MNRKLIAQAEELIASNIKIRTNSQELIIKSKQLIAINKVLRETNFEIRREIANLSEQKKHHDDTATRCRRGSLSPPDLRYHPS